MATELIFRIAQAVGLPVIDVERLVATAPRRYKEFKIRKRNGVDWREIAQPSRELKVVQRFMVDNVLSSLRIHPCAHGYVTGRGIRSNAAVHINSNYILKLDIIDFFPSLRPIDFSRNLKTHAPELLSEEELNQAIFALYWRKKGQRKLRLCIGAPSSPFISNVLMFDLDSIISDIAKRNAINYSRYADDMTFSTTEKDILVHVEKELIAAINGSRYPNLTVNEAKTANISRAQRRVITGVTLSSTRQISIGRIRKREIRNLVHRHQHEKLDAAQQKYLNGLLGFASDIEPSFAEKMWILLADANPLTKD